jgi:hypothetical protein
VGSICSRASAGSLEKVLEASGPNEPLRSAQRSYHLYYYNPCRNLALPLTGATLRHTLAVVNRSHDYPENFK